ncbi:hypothetical protein V2O64_03630 [Verrucomicrobiaceae bacterium 227]
MKKLKEIFEQGGFWVFGLGIPLFLMSFGPYFFGWPEGWATVAGIGYWVVCFGFACWWLGRDEPILGVDEDPVLGLVTRRKSGWDAYLDIPSTDSEDYEDSIWISGGDAVEPSMIQRAMFVEVKDGWGRWRDKLNQILDGHESQAVSAHPRDLCYFRIILAADEMRWSLEFSIERDGKDFDLLAKFEDGEVKELELLPGD